MAKSGVDDAGLAEIAATHNRAAGARIPTRSCDGR